MLRRALDKLLLTSLHASDRSTRIEKMLLTFGEKATDQNDRLIGERIRA